jgi:hypothetical protein
MLTLYKKRDPQTLDFPSRTNEILPTGPTEHHHHPTTVSTVFVTITENPYEIDETATLPPLTLNKKRDPQTLAFPPSRTNEITPTGPSTTRHHHTPVSTVYVTITVDGPSSIHHHHISTETIIITTDDIPTPSPTGTEIDATITLPFYPLPTIIGKDKRVAEAAPNADAQSSNAWPTSSAPTSTSTSRPKENPCQNNIFPPPAWCFGSTSVVTVTVTVTDGLTATATDDFETTATLAPLTLTAGSPPWGRKDKRSRQRV